MQCAQKERSVNGARASVSCHYTYARVGSASGPGTVGVVRAASPPPRPPGRAFVVRGGQVSGFLVYGHILYTLIKYTS